MQRIPAMASLRNKLVAACVLVQIAVMAAMAVASSRLLERTLAERMTDQVSQVVALLDQVIAVPMAQRDYAPLQRSLELVRSESSINYLVLWDARDRRVASAGWDAETPLPPRDTGPPDLDRADTTLHLAMPVVVGGQTIGKLDLGLTTLGLRQARKELIVRSLLYGAMALLLSSLSLAVIAFAITRHLTRLAAASKRMADGDLEVQVPVETTDEIGRLGDSFNAMASALRQRMVALEQSEAKQRLHLATVRDEQARLHSLLGAMRDGILFVDTMGRVIYANEAFSRIWALNGVGPGVFLADIVPQLLERSQLNAQQGLRDMLDTGISEAAATMELHTLDGRIIAQRMQPVESAEGRSGCIWFHDDITLERQTAQRAHQAFHDPLTKLLNRRGLFDALQGALQQADAKQHPLTLMFIDLDDFKLVNDFGGHRAGDQVLQAVADALSGEVRCGELVARLGGDEFAVMCPTLDGEHASALAVRIVNAIAEVRHVTPERTLRLGCSVGIATYPADATAQDDLIACADTAMYQAKQSGKNGWARWRSDPARAQAEAQRVNWNARMHHALHNDGLVLHFQPVFHAADMRLSHHEALLRMVDEQDPQRLIGPESFIGHAERSGKIVAIDRWVFKACVERLAQTRPSVRIAANLSARSLEDGGFTSYLSELLQRHQVDPRRLKIELTETSAISDTLAARRIIASLGALGCAVHLDDFGSGFSSFSQLKQLDVSAIKIDGSLVRALHVDHSNRLFVAAMIQIAHNLNMLTVAEHVEDAATMGILVSMGVDLVQGFHVGRPGPLLLEGEQAGLPPAESPSRHDEPIAHH
jgi:diguanylate cyclase (GGDEF)-like protein